MKKVRKLIVLATILCMGCSTLKKAIREILEKKTKWMNKLWKLIFKH